MLRIVVPGAELLDEATQTFIQSRGQTLRLEHSLVSLSKWESKWQKPFLLKGPQTASELLDYVRCMTLTQNVDPHVYTALTPQLLAEISAYIGAPMTATTFPKDKRRPSREIVTAEIIYYWMIFCGIPFECQKWHLNRLLTLINVCFVKNGPQQKMSKKEVMAHNRALNAARRRSMHSRG